MGSRVIFFSLVILSFFSCRQIPKNDNVVNRDASLKINIVGIEYGDIINETVLSSENNTRGRG